MPTTSNNTFAAYKIGLDRVTTEWGPTFACDLTTFVPVMMSIFSVIVGLSTFTIWPTMMSLGRGGALLMTYTFLAIVSLVVCSISLMVLREGYKYTCAQMIVETIAFNPKGLQCSSLTNINVFIAELKDSQMAKNVHGVMVIAEIIGWCLVGLMISKICICVLTFFIIWFYINTR